MKWAFLLFDMLVPVICIIFGFASGKIAAGQINYWAGFRTSRSIASREAWEFANLEAGKIFLREGIAELILSLIFGILAFVLCPVEVQGSLTVLLELIQSLSIAFAAIWIENQLKKRFKN